MTNGKCISKHCVKNLNKAKLQTKKKDIYFLKKKYFVFIGYTIKIILNKKKTILETLPNCTLKREKLLSSFDGKRSHYTYINLNFLLLIVGYLRSEIPG